MTTAVRCNVCGQPTDNPHEPHDRDCHRGGPTGYACCTCDNIVCPDCCWHQPCREGRT